MGAGVGEEEQSFGRHAFELGGLAVADAVDGVFGPDAGAVGEHGGKASVFEGVVGEGVQVADDEVEEGPPVGGAQGLVDIEIGDGGAAVTGADDIVGDDGGFVDVGPLVEGRFEGEAHPAGVAVVELVAGETGFGVADGLVAAQQAMGPVEGAVLAVVPIVLDRGEDQVGAGVDEREGRVFDHRHRTAGKVGGPGAGAVPVLVFAVAVEEQGRPVPDVLVPEGVDKALHRPRVGAEEIIVMGIDALELVVADDGSAGAEIVAGVAAPVEQVAFRIAEFV